MRTTIALGNSPSSGSSLLANLLDCTPFTACGPELNLFSSKYLYDFESFENNLDKLSSTSSVHSLYNKINFDRIHSYGHSKASFKKLVSESSSLEDFLSRFALHYLAMRGKDVDGFVFEKTPQNITCVDTYLKNTNNYFIHIVRDPLDVYKSLVNRGNSKHIAATVWYFEELKIFDYLDHERVVLIKYEELLENPYVVVSNLINKITGRRVSPESILEYREANKYRELFTKSLSSWGFDSRSVIGRSNKHELTEEDKQLMYAVKNIKVSDAYARYYGIANVCFSDVVEKLGYLESFNELGSYDGLEFLYGQKDTVYFIKKALFEILRNKAFGTIWPLAHSQS